MTFALVLGVLAASPALDAFWARDLGGFARAADEDLFTKELYAFVTCAPLPPVDKGADLRRVLLRVEQARWTRLSSDAAGTLFEDLRSPSFFSRSSSPFAGEKVLEWPAEEETWPGEVALVEVPQTPCSNPSSQLDEAALLEELLEREGELPRPLAARLRFEAATVALRRGDDGAARAHAAKLEEAALDESLRFYATLLRTLGGVEGAPSLSELLARAPSELKPQLAAHAAFSAAKKNDWAAALNAATAAQEQDDGLALYVLLSADRSEDAARLRAALSTLKWPEGSDRTSNTLRALAVDSAVRRLGGTDLVELQRRWEGGYGAPSLELLAQLAISANRLDAANELRLALEKAARRKKAAQLGVELLFLSNDKGFAAAAESFIDDAEKKAAGERTAKALAKRLALSAARNPAGWKWFTALVQKRFDVATRRSWQEALSLAQSETVVVPTAFELPEPPALRVAWPKVHSLLMLPTSTGSHRSWFGAPEEQSRAN